MLFFISFLRFLVEDVNLLSKKRMMLALYCSFNMFRIEVYCLWFCGNPLLSGRLEDGLM